MHHVAAFWLRKENSGSTTELEYKKKADSCLSALFMSLPRHEWGRLFVLFLLQGRGPYSSLLKGTLTN